MSNIGLIFFQLLADGLEKHPLSLIDPNSIRQRFSLWRGLLGTSKNKYLLRNAFKYDLQTCSTYIAVSDCFIN